MLCQLSYRGSLGRKSLAKLGFDLLERVADPRKDSLQLDGPREVLAGEVGELAHDEALLQPEEQLPCDAVVQALLGRGRVELGAQADEILVRAPPPRARYARRRRCSGLSKCRSSSSCR